MKPRDYKKPLIAAVCGTLLLLAGAVAFVVWKDPYQRYRGRDLCFQDSPSQLAGIAANHQYNTAIIGSSMMKNLYPGQIDTLFSTPTDKWVSRNFSIGGIESGDYDILLPYLLSTGKVKHAIIGMDFFSWGTDKHRIEPSLFDDNPLNDYNYIFRISTLAECFRRSTTDVNTVGHFSMQMTPQRKVEVFRQEYANTMMLPPEKRSFDLEKRFDRWRRICLERMANSDDVEWIVVFPPYPVQYCLLTYRYGQWDDVLQFKAMMIEELMKLPGVRIHDFQCEEEYVCDLDSYMDLIHPNHTKCRQMVSDIRAGRFVVTPGNYHRRIERMDSLLKNFRDTVPY